MEPLMTYKGYQIIENSNKSKDLLNSYYEQMGYTVSEPERNQNSDKKTEAKESSEATSKK